MQKSQNYYSLNRAKQEDDIYIFLEIYSCEHIGKCNLRDAYPKFVLVTVYNTLVLPHVHYCLL